MDILERLRSQDGLNLGDRLAAADEIERLRLENDNLVYDADDFREAHDRIRFLEAERDALEDGLLCVYDNLSDPPISDDLAMAMCWRIEARFPRLFNKERVVSND